MRVADPSTTVPIILDCDTGIDDSIALLYLLNHPQADLQAVLSTGGNVPTDVVTDNNLAWLDLCGRTDIEVCRGADGPLAIELRTCEDTHGDQGVGYAELPPSSRAPSARSAADAWIELTAERPGELTGLVIGPLTNLALAIRKDPDLPQRVGRLVIMGGAFDHPGNTTPTAEWNMTVDPEAAQEVLSAFGADGAPQPIICGLQITEQMVMTPAHLDRLARSVDSTPRERPSVDDERSMRSVASNSLVRLISDALRFYFEFHDDHNEGYRAYLHDPLAAAVAVDPGIVRTRAAVVDVELTGTLTRGTTIADNRGFWHRPPNALIATETDPEQVLDDVITRVADLAHRLG